MKTLLKIEKLARGLIFLHIENMGSVCFSETFISANRLSNNPKILNGSGILNADTLKSIDHVKASCRESCSQWSLKNNSDKKKTGIIHDRRDWNEITLFKPPPPNIYWCWWPQPKQPEKKFIDPLIILELFSVDVTVRTLISQKLYNAYNFVKKKSFLNIYAQ